jgi:3-phosphoshikimate 1-carboxyvinyltransferase
MRRLGSLAGFDPEAWTGRLPAFADWRLPGDTTVAAFIAAAASALEHSRVALRDIGFNPTRSGFFDALRLLGARLLVVAKGDRAGHEPVAELQIQSRQLAGGMIGGEIALRCGDSLPALCLLGARSARGLQLTDGGHYAPSGDAAWNDLAALVTAFGAECRPQHVGLAIAAAARLIGARVDAREDRRLALTAVIFGLAAEGETLVENARCLIDDYPDLLAALRLLGAQIQSPAEPVR